MLYIRMPSAILVWQALGNFAMANFEEDVEEMVGTREAAATESGGDETATRPEVLGTRPAMRRRRPVGKCIRTNGH